MANFTLAWHYWNVGRVVTVDVQQNPKRTDYGQRLIEQLSARLAEDYGRGFTAKNLWDMKRFYEAFQIIQPLAGVLADGKILQPAAGKSSMEILPPVAAESSTAHIGQPPADEFALPDILQPVAVKPSKRSIW
jgi:hypothetical protein